MEEACSTTEVFYIALTFTLRLLATVNCIHRDPFMWLRSEDILKFKHLLYTGITLTSFYLNKLQQNK